MELKDFIGKVVIGAESNKRYALYRITSPTIEVVAEQADAEGRCKHYIFNTINGDPISNGILRFEDPTLTDHFKVAYDAYCRSRDAYWEEYGYWMNKD